MYKHLSRGTTSGLQYLFFFLLIAFAASAKAQTSDTAEYVNPSRLPNQRIQLFTGVIWGEVQGTPTTPGVGAELFLLHHPIDLNTQISYGVGGSYFSEHNLTADTRSSLILLHVTTGGCITEVDLDDFLLNLNIGFGLIHKSFSGKTVEATDHWYYGAYGSFIFSFALYHFNGWQLEASGAFDGIATNGSLGTARAGLNVAF